MSNSEVFENVKKAIKPVFDKIDKKAVFYLDEMVTPKLITILYWLLLFASLMVGLSTIFQGGFFRGLFFIFFGAIGVRIACELMIVIFHINENLHDMNIRGKGEAQQSEPEQIIESEEVIIEE